MTHTVPFLDVGATYDELRGAIDNAVTRVLASGWYILGPEVEAFERAFARAVGAEHAAGVGNGLEALVIGLKAAGIGPGDEVIVPSNTYIATWLAVTRCGATIVPVEPDERTYNITRAGIEAALTERTRAVCPVHLYGVPAPMHEIAPLCQERGLFLLDDAAQAHGARCDGRPIGSFEGGATAWSFYPGKNLGAFGDAGALTSSEASIDERARVLRNYGSARKYHNEVPGLNSRLDPLQAAVLGVKLEALAGWNERRARIAARYLEALRDTDLVLPHVPAWAEPAWHLFVVRTPERDRLAARLAERGVQTVIHYPIPPHLQPAYAELGWRRGRFPIAESIHDEVISLPIGPHMNEADVDHVIEATRASA